MFITVVDFIASFIYTDRSNMYMVAVNIFLFIDNIWLIAVAHRLYIFMCNGIIFGIAKALFGFGVEWNMQCRIR